jgi:hypothetical protein
MEPSLWHPTPGSSFFNPNIKRLPMRNVWSTYPVRHASATSLLLTNSFLDFNREIYLYTSISWKLKRTFQKKKKKRNVHAYIEKKNKVIFSSKKRDDICGIIPRIGKKWKNEKIKK